MTPFSTFPQSATGHIIGAHSYRGPISQRWGNGGSLERVKSTFEKVCVPAEQGFAGALKEIEKELFHSTHENGLFDHHFLRQIFGDALVVPEPPEECNQLRREHTEHGVERFLVRLFQKAFRYLALLQFLL
jgi:hypothetical protein